MFSRVHGNALCVRLPVYIVLPLQELQELTLLDVVSVIENTQRVIFYLIFNIQIVMCYL